MLEKARDTLGSQNSGTVGLDASKVQLSELASRASTECLDSKVVLWPQQTQEGEAIDCSMGSFLSYSEESERDQQETHNKGLNFRAYNNSTPFSVPKGCVEESMLLKSDLALCEGNMMFLSSSNDKVLKGNFLPERNSSLLSMNVGVQEEEKFGRTTTVSKEDLKGEGWKRRDSTETSEKIPQGYRLANFEVKLDLNSHEGTNDASSHCQQFDLNGFSWNC